MSEAAHTAVPARRAATSMLPDIQCCARKRGTIDGQGELVMVVKASNFMTLNDDNA